MNHVYRIIWNYALNTWVVASELVSARGKRATTTARSPSRSRGACRGAIAATLLLSPLAAAMAADLPTGASVVSGSGSISSDSSAMTISQSSSKLAINWNSFSIASGNSVTFVQPSATSIALNRVVGSDASSIYGSLSANGRVFLVNPNGVLFGSGASVNVGSLVASTLDLSVSDFEAGNYHFKGNGSNASVVNNGAITAADGGSVALLGGTVSNNGTIVANLGTVALAAGNAVTLDFAGDGLLNVQVDEAVQDALVENNLLIQADGGSVILTASAADALLQTVVNNTGVIQAQTIGEKAGQIVLLGGDSGTVQVAGLLDASAPNGGDGGFIETSGAHVQVADGAQVTTLAADGQTGEWLIDPTDFTISAGSSSLTDSGIGADTLSANLETTSVTLQTVSDGDESGDINVNAAVSWSANTTLTLDAYGDININADITATGASAGLALNYGGYTQNGTVTDGSDYTIADGVSVTLSGANASLSVNGDSYTLIHSMSELDALDAAGSGVTGFYALAEDLDASGTTYTQALVGTSSSNAFSGTFTGLGHTISNLTISAGSTDYVGLFGYTSSTSVIRNLGLVSGSVTGGNYVGGLVGYNAGTLSDVYAEDDVTGVSYVGGLVGYSYGSNYTETPSGGTTTTVATGNISNAYAEGAVTATGDYVGGLVGNNNGGNLTDVQASGNVEGAYYVGGLVGLNYGSNVTLTSYDSTTGALSSESSYFSGNISNAYAEGAVTATGSYGSAGGLVGYNYYGNLSGVQASGNVEGAYYVGGLVGYNSGGNSTSASYDSTTGNLINESSTAAGNISDANAEGSVTATGSYGYVGGLVGYNSGGNLTGVQASGNVEGAYYVGGLVGLNYGSNSTSASYDSTTGNPTYESSTAAGNISDADAEGAVTATGSYVGGLVGLNSGGNLTGVQASGNVEGADYVGGLVGLNYGSNSTSASYDSTTGNPISEYSYFSGNISNANAEGSVTATGSYGYVGGLVGYNNYGNLTGVQASGDVKGVNSVGGLVGRNYGGNYTSANYNSTTGNPTYKYSTAAGNISDAYAEGSVTATDNYSYAGGLVGYNSGGNLSGVQASGNVQGVNYVGGLVGANYGGNATYASYDSTAGNLTNEYRYATGNISDANADGAVTATGNYVGGLVGDNSGGNLTGVQASGDVEGVNSVGGLVGYNNGYTYEGAWSSSTDGVETSHSSSSGSNGVIQDSHASGRVVATEGDAGGLVGYNDGGTISGSHASGDVEGGGNVGGLVGFNSGWASTSTDNEAWTSDGTPQAYDWTESGQGGSITASYATGNVSASAASSSVVQASGGLVGTNVGGTISGSYATGDVSGQLAGGLVGINASNEAYTYTYTYSNETYSESETQETTYQAQVSDSYATGDVTAGVAGGGLAGYNLGEIARTYATGSVTAAAEGATLGALVGVNDNGSAWMAALYQSLTGESPDISGLQDLSGTVSASFHASSDADGNAVNAALNTVGTGAGSVDSLSGGKTWTEMTALSTFTTAGWDISANGGEDTVWRLYEGAAAPLLRGFLTPVTLAVDASAGDKTYDGTIASGTASYTADTDVDDSLILGSLNYASSSKNAGTYSTANGTLSVGGGLYSTQQGYDIIYSAPDTSLTIDRASLTITASNASKTYGETSSLTGYTVSGLVDGDTVSSVSLASNGSATTAGVGSYAITASGADGSGLSNYNIEYRGGTLTVIAAASNPDGGSSGSGSGSGTESGSGSGSSSGSEGGSGAEGGSGSEAGSGSGSSSGSEAGSGSGSGSGSEGGSGSGGNSGSEGGSGSGSGSGSEGGSGSGGNSGSEAGSGSGSSSGSEAGSGSGSGSGSEGGSGSGGNSGSEGGSGSGSSSGSEGGSGAEGGSGPGSSNEPSRLADSEQNAYTATLASIVGRAAGPFAMMPGLPPPPWSPTGEMGGASFTGGSPFAGDAGESPETNAPAQAGDAPSAANTASQTANGISNVEVINGGILLPEGI